MREAVAMANVQCGSCGRDNPVDAAFCNGCGISLDAGLAPVEERRQVTVLFSDVSGYTTMSERTDPEVLRNLMNLVYDRAAEIVEGYGGRIDKLMGDAVLAVFGDPLAHEDDADRAIRAALDLHAAVRELSPRFEEATEQTLDMHSGVNTGIIVTSESERDRFSGPLGDMVNVAARLQSAAGADEIVVGETTMALASDSFGWRDLGPLQLKGRDEAVRAAVVESIVTGGASTAPSRRRGGFVGRHEELGVMLDALERMRDGHSTTITIRADAGVGKTRLLEEFQRLAGDVTWLEGRAYAFTEATPYGPIIDLLTRVARIDERDTADTVRTKLDAVVDTATPGDDDARLATRILFGHEEDEEIDLEAFSERLSAAVVRMVDAAARQSPTVLCFQDLHWSDPSSTALIRTVASQATAPLVIVCNYRPGFDLQVDDARHLELGELSRRQTAEQLTSLLDGEAPPDALIEVVIDRADGNPFFAEEIVNSLIEQNALVIENDTWMLTDDDVASAVPSTVRALLEARIDRLDPARKRLLREASVVGREFLHRVMLSVSSEPEELDPGLARLSAADLVRPPAVDDPDLEYVFKHALTQEVAYAGLLVRDREAIHARAAEAIERLFIGREAEVIETLAYHYQHAGDEVRAAGYLRQAGRKALSRFALTEAHQHYSTAHDLVRASGESPERDRILVETLLDWAHAFYYVGDIRRLDELMIEHADAAARATSPSLHARWLAWSAMTAWQHRGDYPEATEMAERAASMARDCDDVVAAAYAQAWLTWLYWYRGDTSLSIEMAEETLALAGRIDDVYDRRYTTLKALGGAGMAAAVDGRREIARSYVDQLVALGEATGNGRALASGYMIQMIIHLTLGNTDALREVSTRALDLETDPIYGLIIDTWFVGSNLTIGDIEGAMQRHREMGHLPAEIGNGSLIPAAAVARAQIDVLEGRLTQGERALLASRAERRERGDLFQVATIDAFFTVMVAQIATGEAESSFGQALKNPGFVRRHAIGAAKKARERAEQLEHDLTAHHFRGLLSLVHFELGKVEQATKNVEEARRRYEQVLAQLADEPDAQIARDAQARLVELT